MLSEKLLEVIGIDTFAVKNRYGQHKSPTQSARIAFSAPWPSHQVQAVI
jgi:hypothetical protein